MNYRYFSFYVKLLCLTILLLPGFMHARAQIEKQNNNWYFSASAGLNFATSTPTIIEGSKILTQEGCAGVSDEDGNTLFYTNGIAIWTIKNEVMQNGDGMFGDLSATQIAIIPSSGSDQLFYIFTVNLRNFGGKLNYTVVSMAANGGLGSVIQMNVPLGNNFTEKLTSVKHANGSDIWLIAHEGESNRFFAWLVTAGGISNTPVISSAGLPHGGTDLSYIGYLKASADGSNIAIAGNDDNGGFVENFDFNTATGVISNPSTLRGFTANTIPYGIEFSPDGKLLYISEYEGIIAGNLYQVKLPYTSGLVGDKSFIITSLPGEGALQIAPNGKIYFSQYGQKALHSINSPNSIGAACSFEANSAPIKDRRTTAQGLPGYVQNPFSNLSFVNNVNACSGLPNQFKLISSNAVYDDITWDFGDPLSGTANVSHDRDPSHVFTQGGTYLVKVTTILHGFPNQRVKQINIPQSPDNRLVTNNRVVLCADGPATLVVSGAAVDEKYVWYNEDLSFLTQTSGNFITPPITQNTSYYVAINNGVCESEKQKIDIVRSNAVATITAPNTVVNIGESVTLTANDGIKYEWSPSKYLSSTDTKTTVSTPKSNITYQVKVTTADGCEATSTVRVVLKANIAVPNTFTPNGDGVNDFWVVKNLDLVENLTQVFDRNGALVYSMKDYRNRWDGIKNGKPLPTGTYYYIIKLFDDSLVSGSVTIIR